MKKVPFYANLEDNTHCLQASVKMLIEFFENKKLSFAELDKITQKETGKPTWEIATLIYLVENHYQVIVFNKFNYQKFAELGTLYIKNNYSNDVYEYQIQNSNIDKEQKLAKKLINNKTIRFKPTDDILEFTKYLKEDYLIIAHINSNVINDKSGYDGHFVLIYKIDSESVYFQDPGLPSVERRIETLDKFMKAWSEISEAYATKLKK